MADKKDVRGGGKRVKKMQNALLKEKWEIRNERERMHILTFVSN